MKKIRKEQKMSLETRMRLFANLMLDRIIEEEKKKKLQEKPKG